MGHRNRKNNYDGYNLIIPVKAMADVVKLVEGMAEAGLIPEGVAIREKDVLDDKKNRLDLITFNGTDPTPFLIYKQGEGIVDDFRFSKDDMKALAGM